MKYPFVREIVALPKKESLSIKKWLFEGVTISTANKLCLVNHAMSGDEA